MTQTLQLEPSLEEVKRIAVVNNYRRIPVKCEMYADRITTIEAFRALASKSRHCFLLESAEPEERSGRYSFIGFNPDIEITCVNGHMTITRNVEGDVGSASSARHAKPQVEELDVKHPGDAIRTIIAEHKSPQLEGFPPFAGGLVGYFSYDYLKYAEPTLQRDDLNQEDFRDMDLMAFNKLVVFDSYRNKILIIAGVDTTKLDASYLEAAREIEEIYQTLTSSKRRQFPALHLEHDLEPQFSAEEYAAMVNTAKDHIKEGDIFQVVLSNPLTAPAEGSLFDTYRVLRCQNPSPYMFYFTSDDVEIAGSSPETLGKLTNGRLETYPLAGTRPRGATPEEDAALEQDLLADEKELAEHTMLVDLGRNDLGRISNIGSVSVESYLNVLRFSHVMHLGSTVSGTIAADKDAVDAIDSILPAGTLSGAPKIEACKIIQDLEGSKRGIYGGAIGYLDFAGNMDTCIGIRLAYKKNGAVCVQSGAGIVADSDPAKEHQECLNKARAVIEALHEAEGGLA